MNHLSIDIALQTHSHVTQTSIPHNKFSIKISYKYSVFPQMKHTVPFS